MSATDSGWRVAIIDSGLRADAVPAVAAQRRFEDEAGRVRELDVVDDAHGHGTRVAQIIASVPRRPVLLIAQALDAKGAATAAGIAAAVGWSVAQGAQLLHLSLGLAQDRAVLAQAVRQALRAGTVIVAAAPARGALPYPAAYPGVIAASGDARCAREQISALGRPHADFGGCVFQTSGAGESRGGASIGAAHVTRCIVQHLRPGSSREELVRALAARSAFHGPERRAVPASPPAN